MERIDGVDQAKNVPSGGGSGQLPTLVGRKVRLLNVPQTSDLPGEGRGQIEPTGACGSNPARWRINPNLTG